MSGGGLSKILNNLEKCDFITGYSKFKNPSKNVIYRLTDFYTLFYFKFLEHSGRNNNGFWSNNFDSPKIYSWQGYTFELVCLTHIDQIKKKLGISGMSASISCWRGKSDDGGAQIDLLIDRKDRTINICEIKFSNAPYVIDKAYENHLRMRNAIFKSETKTTKTLSITFISVYGVVPNIHSQVVDSEVLAEDLMEK